MQKTVFNFTIKNINDLPMPERGKRSYYRDAKVDGLELMLTDKGAKSFNLYRKVRGRPMRIKLGSFPDMSIEKARGKASEMNGQIADGKSPADDRRKIRAEITFAEMFTLYMERYSKLQKRSWKFDEREVNKFLPHWFSRKLSAISKQDVQALHEKMGQENGLYAANRLLERIRAIYNKAILWGWEGKNPAAGIPKFKEKSRERFLQPQELPYFFSALAAEPNEVARDYLYISLLTGVRKSNVLEMSWDQIHFERAEWRIPRTKNDDPLTVALSAPALEILRNRKKESQVEWVFPSNSSDTGYFKDPKRAWGRLLKRAEIYQLIDIIAVELKWSESDVLCAKQSAEINLSESAESYRQQAKQLNLDTHHIGLPDLRIHDLRRSLGSWQMATGASLGVIGKSLGHKSVQATAVYARLNLDPVRSSVERATDAMLAAAGFSPKG